MAILELTQGKVTLLDDEDLERVSKHAWHAKFNKGKWYANDWLPSAKPGKKYDYSSIHRFVLDAPPGFKGDHRDGDGLNNRKRNLRLATSVQNAQNSRPMPGMSSAYKGVHLNGWGNWHSQICVNGKRINLGVHPTEEAAAEAYNRAAEEYFGEFAWLNAIGGSNS